MLRILGLALLVATKVKEASVYWKVAVLWICVTTPTAVGGGMRATVKFETTAVAPVVSPSLWAVTAAPTRIGFSQGVPSNPLAVVAVSVLKSRVQWTPSLPLKTENML